MELSTKPGKLRDDLSKEIVSYITKNESRLDLVVSNAYYKFPILRDEEESLSIAELLLVSQAYGVLIFTCDSSGDRGNSLEVCKHKVENTEALVYSRLLRNKALREKRNQLKFNVTSVLFSPNFTQVENEEFIHIQSTENLEEILPDLKNNSIDSDIYSELISTIEGARGIVRPKLRHIDDAEAMVYGNLANQIEAEIYKFDKLQKYGALSVLDGFQRIRGLAGSGKTVILAMKAALTHLREPDAKIAYCFYTKSLYQHIKRLITRFYRQFDDKDPNWDNIQVIHGWGGAYEKGMYSLICSKMDIPPVAYREAAEIAADNPFGYACQKLLDSAGNFPKIFDCIFIDEGQDFPKEFIALCLEVTADQKVIYAYDELQTIFQTSAPSIESIRGGTSLELTDDVVLKKCYRNPLEIIVCAHALGFGIYSKIIQMLENRDQWIDVGYEVLEGTFETGSKTIIQRPPENSLETLSSAQNINEIISAHVFADLTEEAEFVLTSIQEDIAQGLRADDILVIAIDDRNAKKYLRAIESRLRTAGIGVNNIHDGSFGIKDFQEDSCVTLSTVHKAKGNESFMVYIVGMDALYTPLPNPKERNMIFTAMTRAKGWIKITGMTVRMDAFIAELEKAKEKCPNLEFAYPNIDDIRTILRDFEDPELRQNEMEGTIDSLLKDFDPDEIIKMVAKKTRRK